MTIRTAAQLRENLKKIKSDNEERLEKIRKQIDEAESTGVNAEALKKQLTQARTTAEKAEELAEKHLKAAEQRELEEAQATETTRKRVAAELEARQKFRAERAWIAAGGDPKEFDASWPSMRQELLKQAVTKNADAPERTQIIHSI